MRGFMVRSKLGIHFTVTSVADLRTSVADAEKRQMILFLNVAPTKQGVPDVNFCYDSAPTRKYIPDQLEEIIFNWYTNQATLDTLRTGYCVNSEYGRKTRVIPLANIGSA